MPLKVGINGFGRMGRLFFRFAWDMPEIEIVHINEIIGGCEHAAYLVKFDSVHGTWEKECEPGNDKKHIKVEGKRVNFTDKKDFTQVDWKGSGCDIVVDSSGKFTKTDKLKPYLTQCGMKKVVVSAPVKEPSVLNIVVGVNDQKLTASHDIITAASCTTNCLAPVIKVMHENLGIESGMITTVHNITATQSLVDLVQTKKNDMRRSRSGMLNLAPTSTGSATAIAEVFPELKGKLNGHAIRVPLLNGSITDIVLNVKKETSVAEVNKLLEAASSSGPLSANSEHGSILGYETRPLVSTDYTNDKRSSIIDAPSTMVVDKKMVKLYAWYDNEVGYAMRMAEIVRILATRGFVTPQAKL
eukprot:TRINITY_DN11245_c0_g1_i2.p1 TRINITY_DN11245_c0_g1~~TRINITY_DN11245_c0_g1_i2.p1  ORF type:complete len:357 (+),score=62.93 TRINITY_DN11245_c0_g1_i2:74-1144(+)